VPVSKSCLPQPIQNEMFQSWSTCVTRLQAVPDDSQTRNNGLQLRAVRQKLLDAKATGYVGAVLGIALVTIVLTPFHARINSTTVGLTFLLVVLFRSVVSGQWTSASRLSFSNDQL
jgi:K+-sensing histidine kinase KdpD